MKLQNSLRNAVSDILIIDDHSQTLPISTLLTQIGYNVRQVARGQQALQDVLIYPPDLILLEIALPDISGYEVCRHLKAMERFQNIPIVFMSARAEPLDILQAFRFGGVDFMAKPLEEIELLARLETHLQNKRQQQQVYEQQLQLQAQNQQLQKQIQRLASSQGNPANSYRDFEGNLSLIESQRVSPAVRTIPLAASSH